MIVFVTNFYNHHQAPLAEALYRLTGGEYRFIAMSYIGIERLSMGWGGDTASFILQFNEDPEACRRLIDEADVVINGGISEELFRNRLRQGKLTFLYSERPFKKEKPWYLMPYYRWRNRHLRTARGSYLLTAGGFTAHDYRRTGTFRRRAYRWAYFPPCKTYDPDALMAGKAGRGEDGIPTVLWAGRLIPLKQPDAVIRLACRLREAGHRFRVVLIGSGSMEPALIQSVYEHGLQDIVTLPGSMKPDEVRAHMEAADVFLFTSNRLEGWGAVLNESMNSGCAVVAHALIGSVPVVIRPGENGFAYADEEELYRHVETLITDPALCERIGRAAYTTIADTWNADTAARRLLAIIDDLARDGASTRYDEGPASPDPVLRENWYAKKH